MSKGADGMKKELEDLSTEELFRQVLEISKKYAKPMKTTAEGYILLDPNDENDREWYENDEENGYHIL